MNEKTLLLATLAACATLSLGCQDRPTSPEESGGVAPPLAKGGKNAVNQTVTFTFRNEGTGDVIFGDGRVPGVGDLTTYTDDECGVATLIPGYNGDANLNTKASTIKKNEAIACGNSTDARVFRVHFAKDYPDDGANDHLDWDDQIMNAKWMLVDDILDIPLGTSDARMLKITFDDSGEHVGHGNGWGQACPGLLRFDSEEWPESSDVQVTRLKQQLAGDDYDEWEIDAAYPNDVAVCLDVEHDQFVALGYYRMPFQMNLKCEGEC